MEGLKALFISAGFIVIVIGLFLIFREIVLWYWKINEMAQSLKLILEELKKINSAQEEDSTPAA